MTKWAKFRVKYPGWGPEPFARHQDVVTPGATSPQYDIQSNNVNNIVVLFIDHQYIHQARYVFVSVCLSAG